MNTYRAEILGVVPFGLTHNDVYATVYSVLLDESSNVQSIAKRRLAGNTVSIIAVFEAETLDAAARMAQYAQSSVFNFSADVIGPYLQK